MSQLIELVLRTFPSSTIYAPQDYAGALNNTCFTKEESAVNMVDKITMLLTGEGGTDMWLTKFQMTKWFVLLFKSQNRKTEPEEWNVKGFWATQIV